jgi:hypothetical protein
LELTSVIRTEAEAGPAVATHAKAVAAKRPRRVELTRLASMGFLSRGGWAMNSGCGRDRYETSRDVRK